MHYPSGARCFAAPRRFRARDRQLGATRSVLWIFQSCPGGVSCCGFSRSTPTIYQPTGTRLRSHKARWKPARRKAGWRLAVAVVARQLGMSPRSLTRHLADERTTSRRPRRLCLVRLPLIFRQALLDADSKVPSSIINSQRFNPSSAVAYAHTAPQRRAGEHPGRVERRQRRVGIVQDQRDLGAAEYHGVAAGALHPGVDTL